MTEKTCKSCGNKFVIQPDDATFYQKMDLPPPTLCPECRYIRRLLDRNDHALAAAGRDLRRQHQHDEPGHCGRGRGSADL